MPRASTPRRRLFAVLCAAFAAVAFLAVPAEAAKEPKKRVAVTAFENEARNVPWHMGDPGGGMAEKLAAVLMETDQFVVLERRALEDVIKEHKLKHKAVINPDQAARLTSAQALIRGVITNVEAVGGEGGRLNNLRMGVGLARQRVTVKLNIRIIDTVTGQIIETQTVEGVASQRRLDVRGRFKGVGGQAEQETKIPIGEAMDDAVAKAVEKIVSRMERIPWQGAIARVSGSQVFINAGYQENVEPGLKLRVFKKGAALIDPETNVDLGSLDQEIGVIEVERVEPRFSIARIVEGKGFAKGNLVRPAQSAVSAQAPAAEEAGSAGRPSLLSRLRPGR